MACIILFNAVLIGLETDMPEKGALWEQLEDTLLLIFTIELAMRVYVLRSDFFSGQDARSNYFDVFIVTSGIIDFVICTVWPDASKSKLSAIMRMLRLLRI